MSESQFSQQQMTAIDALASGASVTRAAAKVGVHRNTISNWRRQIPGFHAAVAQTRAERALLTPEREKQLRELAIETIYAIMMDPKSSHAVRLRAAIAILGLRNFQETEPAAPDGHARQDLGSFLHRPENRENCTILHNDPRSARPCKDKLSPAATGHPAFGFVFTAPQIFKTAQ